MVHSRNLLHNAQFIRKVVLLSCSCLNALPGMLLGVCRVKEEIRQSITFASIAAAAGVLVHLVQIFGHLLGDAHKLCILGLLSLTLQPFRRDSLSCQAKNY